MIEIFNPEKERLAVKIKNALGRKTLPHLNKYSKHYLLVKYGYLLFYVIMIIMAVTGLGLAYEDVPFLRSINKPLIQVHSVVQYLIYLYILVHLAGVRRAETTVSRGIVSGMINGDLM